MSKNQKQTTYSLLNHPVQIIPKQSFAVLLPDELSGGDLLHLFITYSEAENKPGVVQYEAWAEILATIEQGETLKMLACMDVVFTNEAVEDVPALIIADINENHSMSITSTISTVLEAQSVLIEALDDDCGEGCSDDYGFGGPLGSRITPLDKGVTPFIPKDVICKELAEDTIRIDYRGEKNEIVHYNAIPEAFSPAGYDESIGPWIQVLSIPFHVLARSSNLSNYPNIITPTSALDAQIEFTNKSREQLVKDGRTALFITTMADGLVPKKMQKALADMVMPIILAKYNPDALLLGAETVMDEYIVATLLGHTCDVPAENIRSLTKPFVAEEGSSPARVERVVAVVDYENNILETDYTHLHDYTLFDTGGLLQSTVTHWIVPPEATTLNALDNKGLVSYDDPDDPPVKVFTVENRDSQNGAESQLLSMKGATLTLEVMDVIANNIGFEVNIAGAFIAVAQCATLKEVGTEYLRANDVWVHVLDVCGDNISSSMAKDLMGHHINHIHSCEPYYLAVRTTYAPVVLDILSEISSSFEGITVSGINEALERHGSDYELHNEETLFVVNPTDKIYLKTPE